MLPSVTRTWLDDWTLPETPAQRRAREKRLLRAAKRLIKTLEVDRLRAEVDCLRAEK